MVELDEGVVYTETRRYDPVKQELMKYHRALGLNENAKQPKVFLTATADAPLGVVHAVRYGLQMANNALGKSGNIRLVPCPAMRDPSVFKKLVDYNTCVTKRGDKASAEGRCAKEVKKKKKELKEVFCDPTALVRVKMSSDSPINRPSDSALIEDLIEDEDDLELDEPEAFLLDSDDASSFDDVALSLLLFFYGCFLFCELSAI